MWSATGAVVLVCGMVGTAQAQVAPKVPDLSAYDCSLSTQPPAGATITTTHIGQVIKGGYVEWNEYYLAVGNGAPQLVCISHLKPRARQLSSAEAKTFLTDSFAIGAPNAPGLSTALSHGHNAPAAAMPDNVQLEPRKRILRPQPGSEHSQSARPDLPPVPFTRSSDPSSPENTAPVATPQLNSLPATTPTAPTETVGVEDRTAVGNSTTFPWNLVGYLLVTYPNGASYRCSGTLVSPYVVLTAGHCIHNNNRGGFVIQAAFYPGQYQASSGSVQQPYSGHADWQNLKATQGWIQISGQDAYPVTDYQSDFAAIQFKTPFTFTATFMPVVYGNTVTTVTNDGYPGMVNNTNQYGQFTETGPETATSPRASHVREFAVDSSGGDSGGPFWMTDPNTGRPGLIGSLSYGDALNDISGGPWYDSWNQALLSDWVSWTPSAVQTSANSSTGLRIASVFSSAQSGSLSFIRLYNTSTVAGTVDVTLADYATGALLGTWTSPTISPGTSLQTQISTLEQNANTPVGAPPQFYSLSIRPSFNGYVQSVLWRPGVGTITDMTTCDAKTTSDPMTLMNVHTSIVTGYVSTVVVHNTGTSATSVSLGIYDASTGARVGTYVTPTLQPNAQDIRTIPAIEAAARIVPTANRWHYTIRADTAFTGYLQHLLNNPSGVVTDMTAICTMTAQ